MIGSRASAVTFLVASLAMALLIAPGCGTDAHGVEDCRSIEAARCAAASHCSSARGVPLVSDVKSCQLFYRDQCLHGTTTSPPEAGAVDDCVSAIRAAGDCAGADGDAQDSLCAANQTPDTACDLILKPELLEACRFLSPTPSEGGSPSIPTAGAGGQPEGSSPTEGGMVGAGGANGG
jgi:hypothetical protein